VEKNIRFAGLLEEKCCKMNLKRFIVIPNFWNFRQCVAGRK